MRQERDAMRATDFLTLIIARKLTCHRIFPPFGIRYRPNEGTDNEAIKIQRRTDFWHPDGASAGAKCADLCRKHGIFGRAPLCLESKVWGDDGFRIRGRTKTLEDENAKLKSLLAEQMLDAAAMKELLAKKW